MMRVAVVCLLSLAFTSPAFAQAPEAEPPPVDEAEQELPADPSADPDAEPTSEVSEQERSTRNLSFFLVGDLDGRLADIDCRRSQPVTDRSLHYARQVSAFRQRVRQAEQPTAAPIAFNLGDSTFPGALSRYLLTSEEGAIDFADALGQIPFDAHALGDDELGMLRSQFLNFIAGANRVGLPLQASNLACNAEGGAEAICEAAGTGPAGEPWQIIERDGLDIGVVTVLDPDVQQSIARSRAAGLDVLDPSEQLPELVQQLRQQEDVDLVVALYHMVGSPRDDDAVELATAVPGIDLMFTNRLLAAPEHTAPTFESGFVVAPGTGTYLVGASTGHDRAVLVDVQLERGEGGDSWQPATVQSSTQQTDQLDVHEPTADMLRDLAAYFCEDWGGAVNADLALDHPFSREDLEQFILNVMRFTTDSELALVNAQTFVDTGVFPIEDQLTLADIIAFVPYGNRPYTVEVPGEVLVNLAGSLGGHLVAAGLTKEGDSVFVNGRPIQPTRTYRVATHGFLATGGDGVLPQDRVSQTTRYRPGWVDETPTIGTLVAEYVRTAGLEAGELTERLDPTASFPDLHRKFLWSYTGSINSSYNEVSVDNPGGAYEQSQLNVNSTTQINLEANGEIRADSRNHGWDNKLLVQYAQARVSADDDSARDYEETKDLIRFRSIYQYAGLRADAGGGWYVPMPFSELQLESEFSPPNERDWHKVELTGIGGAKFELFDPLDIKIGANARRDINNPNGQVTYGLNLGYLFNRTDLLSLLGKPLQFESELEYFYNDIGASNIQELRNTSRLYFALLDQLFFTTTFQAFLYRTDEVGEFGSNTELTVGLNYLWDATVQSF